MKIVFFIIVIVFISFSLVFFTANSYATTQSSNQSSNQSLSSYSYFLMKNGGGGGGSNPNTSGPYFPAPNITFTPLPGPSLPKFPGFWVNFTIPLIGSYHFSLPNFAELPQFFEEYAAYIFEWIGVQIANGVLYIVQALYLIFAYIEYWILSAFIGISNSLGVFALPVIISLLIVIAIVIRLVISLAKDSTILLGAG
jgi:hypothetical protein